MDEAPCMYIPHGSFSERQQGESVINAYNDQTDIQDALSRCGYTPAGERWHRPGHEAISEPSVQLKDNKSWHWSSNDPLSDGYWKTPFAIGLYYDFHGDLNQAVATIAVELSMDYQRARRTYRSFVAAHLSSKGLSQW